MSQHCKYQYAIVENTFRPGNKDERSLDRKYDRNHNGGGFKFDRECIMHARVYVAYTRIFARGVRARRILRFRFGFLRIIIAIEWTRRESISANV